jgi:enamine deaminase RidA (YjgF/YER057c/UK114 family)
MPIAKEAGTLGMPWEQSYGYTQAVRVGDTIWVSGQLSRDNEGNIVGPAPVDAQGRILDHGNMRIQMAQCYANARKVLAQYGATLDNVVEEVLYVTDMDTAFAVAGAVRAEAYGGRPVRGLEQQDIRCQTRTRNARGADATAARARV